MNERRMHNMVVYVDLKIYIDNGEKTILYNEREIYIDDLPIYIKIAKSIGYNLHKHIIIEVD